VTLGDVDAVDGHLALGGQREHHFAFLAAVLAGQHPHAVTLLDLHSEDLRCQRHDAHELLVTQLAAHRAEDARAPRLAGVVDEDSGVLVEADVAAIGPAALLLDAHDDALDDVAL